LYNNLYQLYSNEEFSVVLERLIYWLVNFQERNSFKIWIIESQHHRKAKSYWPIKMLCNL
jgi:hypothetical protein